jgi:hypothetical protein
MRIDNLLTKNTTNSGEFVFSLPAFALMGNWDFGKHFIRTANAQCTHLQNPSQPLKAFFAKKCNLPPLSLIYQQTNLYQSFNF